MKKIFFIVCTICMFLSSCEKSSVDSNSSGGEATNGSLSRFVVVDNYMYAVSSDALNVYDVSTPSSPVFKGKQNIGFSIQTILPYKNKLYIGSNSAMYIYSLTDPAVPTKISQVPYFITGRDPVIVKDSVAYSTIINNFSGGSLNVFNIKDDANPVMMRSISIANPHGLGIKDSALYVCGGENGLTVYKTTQPYSPEFVKTINISETMYDVIVDDNTLVCYIKGGISFFDISDIYKPVLISTIKN